MKHDINIDKQNNILTFTITLSNRTSLKIPKQKIGFRKMKELLDKNLKLPIGYALGECTNSAMFICNSPDTPDSVSWKFKLIPPVKKTKVMKKQPKQNTVKKRTRKKKTELK